MRHVTRKNDGSFKKKQASRYGGLYATNKGPKLRENYDFKFINQLKRIQDQQNQKRAGLPMNNPKVTRSAKKRVARPIITKKMLKEKRIEDKKFEATLKSCAVLFRDELFSYHNRIIEKKAIIVTSEIDMCCKLQTLNNIRKLCSRVFKLVIQTEKDIHDEFTELVTI
jgi:hypothetical protein